MQNEGIDRLSEAPRSEPRELQRSVDALRKTYGVTPSLPKSMDQKQMTKKLDEFRSDAVLADYSELLTYNQLQYRKNSLQREAQQTPVDKEEFITVNQAETYFEYLKTIIGHTLQTSDDYLTLRRSLPSIPLEILREERDLELFHNELDQMMRKRLDFSNASLAAYLLTVQRDRKGVVMQDQKTLVDQLDRLKKGMDASGQAALGQQDRQAIRIHMNSLDQQIIELIAGKGDLPARMLLSLQTERYRIVLEQQKAIIKDGGLAGERAEWEKLKVKNGKARDGQGPPLDEKESKRFLELQDLLNRAKPKYTRISEERRDLSNRIVRTAEDLTEFQQRALELVIVQKQFKSSDVSEGATNPNPDDTPPLVRKKIDEVTEQRGTFHRERLASFAGRFEEEVLTIGVGERIEDLSNKTGREFVRRIGNKLSSLVTWPAPETGGVRDFLRGRLSGPLNDAMGWPVDKMDKKFEELEPFEQKEVIRRSRSIADAVREFDRNKIRNVQNALSVIQFLPPAKEALGQQPKDPLPDLPPAGLTPQNMKALIAEHGLATVYLLAIRQMDLAMGDPRSGFIGEIQTFTDKVNEVIDVHLDVADALHKEGNDWKYLMYALLAAAGITLARGAYVMGRMASPRTYSPKAPKIPKSAPVKGPTTSSGALKTGETLAETAQESMKAFDKLQEEIRAARAAKDNKKVIELLKASEKLIEQQAKAGNPGAKGMLGILRVLKIPAWAGNAFKFIGPVIDAILLGVNEWELSDAKGDKNSGLQQTLESKRKVLAAQGGVGLTMLLGFSGPQALAVAPFAVATAIYTSKVFDGAAQWDRNWMKETPEQLKIELEKVAYGHTTAAHSAAVGSNEFERPFTQWGKAPKDIEKEELRKIESINESMRESILTAYFLKTMKVAPQLPTENDNQFRDRIGLMLRDRINYVRRLTGGTYVYSVTNERLFYDFANHYGDLMGARRTLESQSLPTVLSYEYDGKDKTLDLAPLKFVSATGKPNEADQMKFLTLLAQYDNELSPQIEMARAVRKEMGKK